MNGKKKTNLLLKKQNLLNYLLTFLSFWIGMFVYGQTQIQGKVTDSLNQPIAYANILLQEAEGHKILKFTSTNQEGDYQFSTEKTGIFKLAFISMGYAKKEVQVEISGEESITLNVILFEEEFQLEEVIIQDELPISVKKDTIIFNADSFRRGTEVVVEDLLKNLPGVEVDGDGTIRVGNREIERLMVGGDDLFEKGYKVLSKNMTSDAVDKIEIYDKYSNNRLLKGIEESDRVAMNIKL
ncbi:MAG: carboxypeptidase-like regulatory domain-containing protein, partial [Psychroflexus sp.]